jgi:hypothetical protein
VVVDGMFSFPGSAVNGTMERKIAATLFYVCAVLLFSWTCCGLSVRSREFDLDRVYERDDKTKKKIKKITR